MSDTTFPPELIARIRSQIVALAEEGSTLRCRIQSSHGRQRDRLWNEKRRIGVDARRHLLLYGFLRGVAYQRLEARCRHGNRPQASSLWRFLGRCIDSPPLGWEQRLKDWLAGKPALLEPVSA